MNKLVYIGFCFFTVLGLEAFEGGQSVQGTDETLVVLGRNANEGQMQTFTIDTTGVLRRATSQTLPFQAVAVAFNPNGTLCAVSGKVGDLYIFSKDPSGSYQQIYQQSTGKFPIISLAYDTSGQWLAASSSNTLFLFQQKKDGSLSKSSTVPLVSRALHYSRSGVLGALTDLGTKLITLIQNRGMLQESGSVGVTTGFQFKDLCFSNDGSLIVAEHKNLGRGSPSATKLYSFKVDDTAGTLVPSNSKIVAFPGTVTSLSAHPHRNIIVAALVPENIPGVQEPAKVVVFNKDSRGNLSKIASYPVPELGVKETQGNIVVKYDDFGKWLGVVNDETGDFVLFEQNADGTLRQVDVYTFGLSMVLFNFVRTGKSRLKKALQEKTGGAPLPEDITRLISDFVQ